MNQSRYSRQISLPEMGAAGQQKLAAASILCIGAGGLGCPALLYLATAGLGRIGIVDFDLVAESNLQRQILFSAERVGQPKTNEAAKRLKNLNPDIQIDVYDEALTTENAAPLFSVYDLVLDGTDNFETKFLINEAAVKLGKPWIYGAIQGFDGQVSVFNGPLQTGARGPCYRCLYPEKPKARILNCAEAGVMGAVAGIIGVTQSLQAIQLIVGHARFSPLIGKLWMLDTRTMATKILNLEKRSDCPVCSRSPEEIAFSSYDFSACQIIREITVDQLKQIKDPLLIDVREQEEWDRGHIEGARLWPLSRLMKEDLPNLSKDVEMILYCQKGLRSLQAARTLKARGFLNVTSLSGGFEAWTQSC